MQQEPTAPEPAEPDRPAADPALRPVRLLVEEHLADPTATWLAGVSGALAGFVRGADEQARRGPNSVVTPRGGLRVTLPDDAVAVAYECPSARDPLRWHQAVAFCVPEAAARTAGRTVVTELGPDRDALRPQDTTAVLFDLGLGVPTAEVLVRTADPDTLAALRAVAGRDPSQPGSGLSAALAAHTPHVVVRTVAARLEVHANGLEGAGPHVRLQPGRARAAAVPAHLPIPPGWVSVLRLRPAHPAAEPDGRPRPFDVDRHVAFRALLAEYGDPLLGVAQADAVAAVRAIRGPHEVAQPTGPTARAAVAVALRRLTLTDGTSAVLANWRSHYGPTPELADPDEC